MYFVRQIMFTPVRPSKNLVQKTNKIKLKLITISNIWKRENLNNNFKSITSLAKDNYNKAYCKPTVITL